MTAASDIRYGRRGGLFTDNAPIDPTTAPTCELCQRPMLAGQRRSHLTCAEAARVSHPQAAKPRADQRTTT